MDFLHIFVSEFIKVGVTSSNLGIIHCMIPLSCSTHSLLSNEPMYVNIGCLVLKLNTQNQRQLPQSINLRHAALTVTLYLYFIYTFMEYR